MTEVDKFLNNEGENGADLKKHYKYMNYDFEFIDKSFPSQDSVASMMHSKN